MDINCLNPQVIVSRNITSFIARCRLLVTPKGTFTIDRKIRGDILYGRKSVYQYFYIPYPNTLSVDSVDDYYFVDDDDVCYNVFDVVPCGSCDCCLSRKLFNYTQRCHFQSLQSKVPTWYITLTYAHEPAAGCYKRDVQLFIKRLRKNLDLIFFRRGYSTPMSKDLKYFCSSEYGHDSKGKEMSGRVHYHLFIFGLPYFSENTYENLIKVSQFFRYCWRKPERHGKTYRSYDSFCADYPKVFNVPKDYDSYSLGYVNVKLVDFQVPMQYLVKYLLKYEDRVYKGIYTRNQCFMLFSNNLGLDFVKSKYQQIRDTGKIQYYDYLKGKYDEQRICSYYCKKLFPSASYLIPCELRKAWINYRLSMSRIMSFPYNSALKHSLLITYDFMYERFKYLDILDYDVPVNISDNNILNTDISLNYRLIMDDVNIIDRCLQIFVKYDDIDFLHIQQMIFERDKFFSNFISRNSDKYTTAKRFRSNINKSKDVSIL